jgi:hypothetical protein
MPYARKTDPGTSHLAARSVQNISPTQQGILRLLVEGMNDEALVNSYAWLVKGGYLPAASESGIRSRRAELVKLGLVVDTGERNKMTTGRLATVWKATTSYEEELESLW